MSYQLYNDTSTIRIVENGKAISLPKTIALKVFGNELQIFLNEDSPYISIDYTTVTVPVVTSSEDLRSQVEAWLDGGVTVTIDDSNIVAAITDGTQKTQLVDSLGNNLGTNTNPLNVEKEGLATYQMQYNQEDLLNLILIELQEQTRILKKIYQ